MAYLEEGFPTLITFAQKSNIKFKEIEVTPPGIDAGGEVDITTMRNTAWRTRSPKKLKTATEIKLTAAYDPAVYTDIVAIIGENQLITIHFSDNSTVAVWGWLDKFIPGSIKEGEMPRAEVTIIPSNHNGASEVAPAEA